jgi:hypothetical protein
MSVGAWSDKAIGLETASPATQPAQDVLDMLSCSGPADPGRNESEAASGPQFDQSVSGQFFQLLAGLGEKVIMESCRYEAMLTGVRHQAGEIDNLVAQWEQYFAGSSPLPDQGERPAGTTVEFNWDAIVGQNSDKKPHIQAIQSAAGDFLNCNPDLAGDRHKVRWWSLSQDASASAPKMPPPSVTGPGRHYGPGVFPEAGRSVIRDTANADGVSNGKIRRGSPLI